MKKLTIGKITVVAILFMGLAGCNFGGGGHNNSSASSSDDTDTGDVSTPPITENEGVDSDAGDFPEEALAVRPEPSEERRSNGSVGNNEIYYLSLIAEEEIGCVKRTVNVRGTFSKNNSENWMPGQITEWESENTQVVVTVTEDTVACGGALVLSENIVTKYSNEFNFNVTGSAITFYAEIPVYNAYADKTYNITISVDGSQAAQGELLGGHIFNSTNTEWGNEYDSSSNSHGEGVNIVLDGGIYIDNLAIIGSVRAKVSKYTSDYDNNGKKPEDPFSCCVISQKG